MTDIHEAEWLRKIADFMHCVDQIENADAKDLMKITLSGLQRLSGASRIFLVEVQDKLTATVSYAIPSCPDVRILDPVFFENVSGKLPLYFRGTPFPELGSLASDQGTMVILPLSSDEIARCVILVWNDAVQVSPAFEEFIYISFSVMRRVTKLLGVFYSIEQLEVHFHAILQTVPQSIIFVDNSGRSSWVNENASRLFNLPSGNVEPALLSCTMQAFRNLADNRDEIYHRGMKLFQSGQKVTGNWKWIYSVPEPLVLNGYCTPVASRSVEGVLWVFDDITDKHFADQEINQLNDKLKQASDYKSQFLANISHELRTPLNSIIVLANLLKENDRGNLTSKQVNHAGIIINSGKDLLYLIDDILDISKIEAGKMDLHFEPENIKEFVETIQGLFVEVARSNEIEFRVNVSSQLPETIVTDRLRLSQIFKNLLSNAFKFTPKRGKVELDLGSNEDNTLLSFHVSDTGIGIEDDKKHEIFEAFKQADGTTSRNYGGTGLGLSISKELVWKFGGQISVESCVGKGSKFSVEIPLLQEEENRSGEEQSPAVVERVDVELDGKDYKELKGKKILLASNNIRQVFSINAALTDCGISVAYALSYEELGGQLQRQIPDALVIDAEMDHFSVVDLIRLLKEKEICARILVVSSTGILQKEYGEPGIEAVLKKPINFIQLLTELKRSLTS